MRWSTSFLCNLCYRCQVRERSEEDSGSRCDDLVMSEHKEQWSTPDSIRDAHERLLARATGWQPPAAYGIAYLPEGAGGAKRAVPGSERRKPFDPCYGPWARHRTSVGIGDVHSGPCLSLSRD